VWEAYRQNWVWESGLTMSPYQPLAISGVHVNSSWYPLNSGYYVDYVHGQVVFDTPISASSVVQLEYSHKWVKVLSATDVPFFKNKQEKSFRVDNQNFMIGSGSWIELADTRLQLPLIAVEVTDNNYEGYQLGGGQWGYKRAVLHVLGEDPSVVKKITTILSEQNEATILLYDPDIVKNQNKYALDYRGSLTSNPLCYPSLIAHSGDGGCLMTNRVQHGKMRIFDAHGQHHGQITKDIYHGTVNWSTSVILPKI
jgi:hypothetical protein